MGQGTAFSLLLALTAVTAVTSFTEQTPGPLVNAPWGKVKGIRLKGDQGRKMNAYLAIPYALPPTGKRRFEKPEPHPGPEKGEVFVADHIMPACPQVKFFVGKSRKTSEDCLKLDLYAPASGETGRPYPVMIFIHGAGFTMGDAHSYRPSRLVVDGRMIVAVIQYRLGALGFLSTGDDTLPGNQGFWDQNLAIRWVKDNVAAFGGDPNRITLFGESSGSMSVNVQMMSPQSRGLFQRGIMQSGAIPVGFFSSSSSDQKAIFKGLADACGCQGEDTAELVSCLKEKPEDEFFNKTIQYAASSSPLIPYYLPIIDGEFMPKDMSELVKDEQYMKENGIDKIDLIVGMNNKEGALMFMCMLYSRIPPESLYTADMFRRITDHCLVYRKLKRNSVIKKSIEFYYRGAEATLNVSETLDGLINMYGDCVLIMDIIEWTRSLAASCHSGARHLYAFDHDFVFNKDGPVPGTHHGDELILEFDNVRHLPDDFILRRMNKTRMAQEEHPLANEFIQILTSFAKTGNPTTPSVKADLGGTDWPSFNTENESYLSLSQTPRLMANMEPYRDRAAFWDRLLPELNTLTADLSEEPPEPPMAAETPEDSEEPREEF